MSTISVRPRVKGTTKKPSRKQKRQDPNLQLRPAFRGQVCMSMKIEGTPVLFANASTTGLVNPVCLVNTSSISNFATRFGALFEEYRFVKASFSVRLFSSTATGLLVSWVDEKVFSAPTLAESRTKSNTKDMLNASAVDKSIKLIWTPHDNRDLQYTDIGTSTSFAAFKIYSDSPNYGINSTFSTNIGEIFPVFTVQFRGLL